MTTPRLCSVDGCDKPTIARGFCTLHYQRWKRHGDPTKTKRYEGALCSVEGCSKVATKRLLCRAHYWRLREHGHPLAGRTELGAPRKFLDTVAIPYQGDDCLPWPFGHNGLGYGVIQVDGEQRLVNRLICEAVYGPPPTQEHEAAHSCGNAALRCCTPRHLRWATPSENQMDRVIHGTHQRGERHPLRKLTEHDVREIRRLALTNSHADIARRYGVGRVQISRIAARKRWGWLA